MGTRCGFDLSSGEQDLGAIVNVKDEGCISVLGTLVSDVSCTVLRNMNREIMSIEKERKARRMGHSPDKWGTQNTEIMNDTVNLKNTETEDDDVTLYGDYQFLNADLLGREIICRKWGGESAYPGNI